MEKLYYPVIIPVCIRHSCSLAISCPPALSQPKRVEILILSPAKGRDLIATPGTITRPPRSPALAFPPDEPQGMNTCVGLPM